MATATVSRAGGNGVALVVLAADLALRGAQAINEFGVVALQALRELRLAEASGEAELHKLYHATRGDSVDPEVLELLCKHD